MTLQRHHLESYQREEKEAFPGISLTAHSHLLPPDNHFKVQLTHKVSATPRKKHQPLPLSMSNQMKRQETASTSSWSALALAALTVDVSFSAAHHSLQDTQYKEQRERHF